MPSKSKTIAEIIEVDGDIVVSALDNVAPSYVSDKENTSTGALGIPSGTTAQRPSSPYVGYQRFNTDLSAMENWNGTEWLKVSVAVPSITSISGNINDAYETTLTITGLNFLLAQGSVEFTPAGGSTTSVNITPTSDTQITVNVPAAIYGESAGTVVTIEYTNSDGATSISGITKTVIAAPTGGTITTDGTARIHTFTSSGTFTNNADITSVRYLIVAGGGGGAPIGGGGGAGGYLAGTSMSVSNTSYSITVGGGANGGAGGVAGGQGGNSTFNGLTAIGGGGGGAHDGGSTSVSGTNGGSGGGGSDSSNSYGPGSGTAGQGNNGGSGSGTYNQNNEADRRGGGGGGAGAVGGSGKPAHGGVGVQNDILGTNYYWAGGGGGSPYGSATTFGGGDGGNGGGGGASSGAAGATGGAGTGGSGLNAGGNGQNTSSSVAGGVGGANTGGGGGGSNWSYNGTSVQSGGDGIVVIRYEM